MDEDQKKKEHRAYIVSIVGGGIFLLASILLRGISFGPSYPTEVHYEIRPAALFAVVLALFLSATIVNFFANRLILKAIRFYAIRPFMSVVRISTLVVTYLYAVASLFVFILLVGDAIFGDAFERSFLDPIYDVVYGGRKTGFFSALAQLLMYPLWRLVNNEPLSFLVLLPLATILHGILLVYIFRLARQGFELSPSYKLVKALAIFVIMGVIAVLFDITKMASLFPSPL